MKRIPEGSDQAMGRIIADLEVANNDDVALERRGVLPADQVRRRTVKGLVDSGATRLVLPAKLVKELGLPVTGKIRVRYADNRTSERNMAEGVYVELLGRHSTFAAVVEPKREDVLIGAIVLEDLDLLVDCQRQKVVPRDPQGPIYEIE
jgi:predicted aspartyl protease